MKRTILYLAALFTILCSLSTSCTKDDEKDLNNGIVGNKSIPGWSELPYLKLPQIYNPIYNHEKAVGRVHYETTLVDGEDSSELKYFASDKMDVVMGVAYGFENTQSELKAGVQLLFVDKEKFETLLLKLGFTKEEKQEEDGEKAIIYKHKEYNISFTYSDEINEDLEEIRQQKGLNKVTGVYIALLDLGYDDF